MGHFQERFENSQIINNIGSLEDNIEKFDFSNLDPTRQEAALRLQKILKIYNKYFANVDPSLLDSTTIDLISKTLRDANAKFSSFKSDNNLNHLVISGDDLLKVLNHNFRPESLLSSKDFSKILDEFNQQSLAHIKELKIRQNEVKQDNASLSKKVIDLQNRSDNLTNKIKEQEKRFDTLINNQQKAFNDSQVKLNELFAQAQSSREKEFKELVSKYDNNFIETMKKYSEEEAEHFEVFSKDADKYIKEINNKLEESKKIVGIIANTSLAGHFKIIADKERWVANALRVLAIIFLLLMSGTIITVLIGLTFFSTGSVSWQIGIYRIGFAFAIGAPAWYCIRESSKHRRFEQRNRKIELELAAINPFLDNLPDDKKQNIVAELADRYFGQRPDEEDDSLLKIKNLRGKDFIKGIEEIAKIVRGK